MSRSAACVWMCALWLGSSAAACSFDAAREDRCSKDDPCPSGRTCERGFCVYTSPSDRGDKDASSDESPGTGMMENPSTRADGGNRSDAGAMPKPDAGSGQNDAGMSMMPTDSGMMPGGCRNGEVRACMLPGSTAQRCRAGNQTCQNGSFGPCVATETPSAEQCNGVDDDCDGETDEGASEVCYPDDMMGCTLEANRAPRCQGLCSAGMRMCRNGKLEDCTGAIMPQMEVCTSSGAAADENCNGMTDETCSCRAGEMRSCYTGANGTIDVGTCRAGSQTCTNGMLGPCMGAVVPQAETCMNESSDDDCNGTEDDIPSRGMTCVVESNMGVCRTGVFQCAPGRAELTCVTPMGGTETCNMLDDDCDGMTDETTNLQTDTMNCGMCGRACGMGESCCSGDCVDVRTANSQCGGCGAPACADGTNCCGGACLDTATDSMNCGACGNVCETNETCCGGQCVNTQENAMHCGGCGRPCTDGTQPGCCDGACVDFLSQDHCGRCNHACGILDGVTCTCSVQQEGTVCFAPLLGICL